MENQEQPTQQPETPQYDYVGSAVQIGTGFGGMKPVAQQGTVTIAQGTLALFNDAGELIDQAPLSSVSVKSLWYTGGGTAMITLDTRRYSVAIGHGQFLGAPLAALGATTHQTKDFIKAVERLKAS